MNPAPTPSTISDSLAQKRANPQEETQRDLLWDLRNSAPIPAEELKQNIALFLDRRILSRFLFINELYQKILPLHGSILEFGVRYGQNLALFSMLRGIYEPWNGNRKVVGFDTFSGFPSVDAEKDAKSVREGEYSVPENYRAFLESVLLAHEQLAPLENLRKFELVEGDAIKTITEYLNKHQETLISLAYFDLDIYPPTKECLAAIKPYLTNGSIVAFDEMNTPEWPGETVAFREIFPAERIRVHHSPFRGNAAYIVIGDNT